MVYQITVHQKTHHKALLIMRFCLISIVIAFGSAKINATELDAKLYSDTEYTTNANLSKSNAEDDVIQRVGLDVLLTEKRKRFNADASFKLTQEFYLNNTFSDQTQLTTGFGLFNFDIVDDFLDWRTSFTRTQVLSDSSAGDTPDNREERDTFRTGPTVNYRINQASILQVGANYVQVENSDEDSADTKRFNANSSYIYKYNSITDFSLNGSYDQIFESDQGSTSSSSDDEIRNISLSIGMKRQFSHGLFNIMAGQNQVHSDTNETIKGNFFDILFQREQVLSHNLQIQYSESISDSSIGFDSLDNFLAENPDTSPVDPSPETTSQLDIIKQKSANITIDRSIDAYQYSMSIFWKNQDYEVQQNDEQSTGVIVNVSQNIQEGLTGGFTYQYVKQELIDRPNDGDNLTQTYSIDTEYQWTRDFSTDGYIAYNARSNNKNSSREYEEISIGVTLNWDLY